MDHIRYLTDEFWEIPFAVNRSVESTAVATQRTRHHLARLVQFFKFFLPIILWRLEICSMFL